MVLWEMLQILAANTGNADVTATATGWPAGVRWLNTAMCHVWNLVDATDGGWFRYQSDATVSAGSDDEVLVEIVRGGTGTGRFTPPAWALFRRLTNLWRTNYPGQPGTVELQIVQEEDRAKYITAARSEQPAAYLTNSNSGYPAIALLSPVAGISLRMRYVFSPAPMCVDTDQPGQYNGQPPVPPLPHEYHELIPVYATVLALSAEQSDSSAWRATFAEMWSAVAAVGPRKRGERLGAPSLK